MKRGAPIKRLTCDVNPLPVANTVALSERDKCINRADNRSDLSSCAKEAGYITPMDNWLIGRHDQTLSVEKGGAVIVGPPWLRRWILTRVLIIQLHCLFSPLYFVHFFCSFYSFECMFGYVAFWHEHIKKKKIVIDSSLFSVSDYYTSRAILLFAQPKTSHWSQRYFKTAKTIKDNFRRRN